MFGVGSQVIRESNDQVGMVFAERKNANQESMIEVQWASGVRQWLPSGHVFAVSRQKTPPKDSGMPSYLKEIPRTKSRYNSHREQELAARQLAESLLKLGSKRKHGGKQKAKNKAKKLIANFEKGVHPNNMRRDLKPKPEYGTNFSKPAWHYTPERAEQESMRKLYLEKSRCDDPSNVRLLP